MVLHEHTDDPAPQLDHVLRMLLVHDIVEIDAGDTFAFDTTGHVGKLDRERAAADRLFGQLPIGQRDAYRALWNEFEAAITPEARYANAIDRLQAVTQNVVSGGGSWLRYGVTREQVMQRVAPVEGVSAALWSYTLRLLDRAEQDGALGVRPA